MSARRLEPLCSRSLLGTLVFVWLVSAAVATDTNSARIAADPLTAGRSSNSAGGYGWKSPWRLSRVGTAAMTEAGTVLHGIGNRDNPLRRQLAEPFRGPELFVRYRLRYEEPDDDEFVVLWLDRLDAGDVALHAQGVPNIGIAPALRGPTAGRPTFMVRVGTTQVAWSTVALEPDRDYLIVARLAKSAGGERDDFDTLQLWVDPSPADFEAPLATLARVESLNFIGLVGFATGRKTEADDAIVVRDLALTNDWHALFGQEAPPPEAAAGVAAVPARESLPGTPWEGVVDFGRDVHPLLEQRCFGCHAGELPEGGVRLDVRREILGYGTGDPLAEPGRASASRIIDVVTSSDPKRRMPPEDADDRLDDREVGLLAAWIEQGLTWDEALLPEPRIESDHWAFQPVRRPAVPRAAGAGPVANPVDAFIASRLTEVGLEFSEVADPVSLVRRLHLDLIGLPPTPEDVEAFRADWARDPDATLRATVDRLLDSRHYGERWGRYWLDLARWAESHGHQHDVPRPYAWRYRDYVISSFNADKPYDRFLAEQLAGDELRPYADENLIATGFLAAARISGNDMDKAAQRNDVLVDIVNATGSAVLGLTLECAQCHNHKFEPISQRDYYRMQAFFVKGQLANLTLRDPAAANPLDLKNWMTADGYRWYIRESKKWIKAKDQTQPHTWGYIAPGTADPGIRRLPEANRDPLVWKPQDLAATRGRLLVRGDVHRPGPEVAPGWPEVLGGLPDQGDDLTRRDLVAWLTDLGNPLVARVWVNRLWQWHFGRGIVKTASDFGTAGSPPTHPQLLDWLASELMDHGWSTKHIHRLIVLSRTYRQARKLDAAALATDPENTLLWTWPRRRLEAEAIRDVALAVSGELDREVGGPSVPPQREEQSLRRTLYLYQRRSELPDAMTLFDAPDTICSCAEREVSTVALQPLYLLNSPFMMRRAEAFAKRVDSLAGAAPEARIAAAFQLALGRQPDADEAARAAAWLAGAADGEKAFIGFCHAVMNLNEAIYIP